MGKIRLITWIMNLTANLDRRKTGIIKDGMSPTEEKWVPWR